MMKYLYIINPNLFLQEELPDHTDGIKVLDSNFLLNYDIYNHLDKKSTSSPNIFNDWHYGI